MGFESSLKTLIVIFQNVSPKGLFLLIIKNFDISILTGILDNITATLNESFITSNLQLITEYKSI